MSEFISIKDTSPPNDEEIEVVTITRMYRSSADGEWKMKYPDVPNYARVVSRRWDETPFTHWRRIEEMPADAVAP